MKTRLSTVLEAGISNLKRLLAMLLLITIASTAHAALITQTFTGVVSQVSGGLSSSFIGDAGSYTFTIDTTLSDFNSDPNKGSYSDSTIGGSFFVSGLSGTYTSTGMKP